MKYRFFCQCGADMVSNVWLSHLKSKNKCTAKQDFKDRALHIIQIKKEKRFAWKKSLAEEATADRKWFLSVIFGETTLDDWSFDPLRVLNQIRPSTIKRYSIERRGSNNPAMRVLNFSYDVEEMKKYARVLYEDDMQIGDIHKKLKEKYHHYRVIFANLEVPEPEIRGHNKNNYILSQILNVSLDEIIHQNCLRRGKKISIGQKSSEKFRLIASKHAANMVSSPRRVTKPQINLYERVIKVLPDATLERCAFHNCKFMSFDIFSESSGIAIEMHGRVFHDPNKSKPQLKEILERNLASEENKKDYCKKNNIMYFVFWDDEMEQWDAQIMEMYEKIKNKIN